MDVTNTLVLEVGQEIRLKRKRKKWKLVKKDSFVENFVDEDTGEVVSITREPLHFERIDSDIKEDWHTNMYKIRSYQEQGELILL